MSRRLKSIAAGLVAASTLLGGWALTERGTEAGHSGSSTAVSSRTDLLPYRTAGNYHAADRLPAASVIGVNALYGNETVTYERYPYVGTLGAKCLVIAGYDPKYSEYPLRRVPSIEVAVFRRYGYTEERGKLYYDAGSASAVKRSLATQQRRCRPWAISWHPRPLAHLVEWLVGGRWSGCRLRCGG